LIVCFEKGDLGIVLSILISEKENDLDIRIFFVNSVLNEKNTINDLCEKSDTNRNKMMMKIFFSNYDLFNRSRKRTYYARAQHFPDKYFLYYNIVESSKDYFPERIYDQKILYKVDDIYKTIRIKN
jgi:hypothetical protein